MEDLTPDELQAQAEDLAHRAGLPSAKKAFALLDAGKLDGTILESELRTIRFLLREPPPKPPGVLRAQFGAPLPQPDPPPEPCQ